MQPETTTPMEELLTTFRPITLDEMSSIRLMNRTDTKFVTTASRLMDLLELAREAYRVQTLGLADGVLPAYEGRPVLPYSTTYFDTPDYAMFYTHQHGHANRQKLRIRTYDSSAKAFLEVKTKNNHGRTRKKRIALSDDRIAAREADDFLSTRTETERDFLSTQLRYDADTLRPKISNHFDRITLVNLAKTERLTIDCHLTFDNPVSGAVMSLPDIAIIELKRDGLLPSPIVGLLNRLRIKPLGFSKYCIGSALTQPDLRINRFKPRLRAIDRILRTQAADSRM